MIYKSNKKSIDMNRRRDKPNYRKSRFFRNQRKTNPNWTPFSKKQKLKTKQWRQINYRFNNYASTTTFLNEFWLTITIKGGSGSNSRGHASPSNVTTPQNWGNAFLLQQSIWASQMRKNSLDRLLKSQLNLNSKSRWCIRRKMTQMPNPV